MPETPDPHPTEPARRAKCPRCGREFSFNSVASHKTFPFCSQRCRDVDLGNWFTGKYAIPVEESTIDIPDDDELSPERDAT